MATPDCKMSILVIVGTTVQIIHICECCSTARPTIQIILFRCRYFDCQQDYGLFAPIQKVTLVQRRVSVEPDRRRPADPHTADEDGYY